MGLFLYASHPHPSCSSVHRCTSRFPTGARGARAHPGRIIQSAALHWYFPSLLFLSSWIQRDQGEARRGSGYCGARGRACVRACVCSVVYGASHLLPCLPPCSNLHHQWRLSFSSSAITLPRPRRRAHKPSARPCLHSPVCAASVAPPPPRGRRLCVPSPRPRRRSRPRAYPGLRAGAGGLASYSGARADRSSGGRAGSRTRRPLSSFPVIITPVLEDKPLQGTSMVCRFVIHRNLPTICSYTKETERLDGRGIYPCDSRPIPKDWGRSKYYTIPRHDAVTPHMHTEKPKWKKNPEMGARATRSPRLPTVQGGSKDGTGV